MFSVGKIADDLPSPSLSPLHSSSDWPVPTSSIRSSSSLASDARCWIDWSPLIIAPSVDILLVSAPTARKSLEKETTNHLQPPGKTSHASDIPPPQAFPAVLSRPPIRPPISSISKSKFELEPNPFEQSFSRSSTSIHSHHTGSSSEDFRREKETGGATTTGTRKTSPPPNKTALPPVSALTSPAPLEPGPHFSWSGLSSSLRAGPLSPAMLTGPAGSHSMTHGPSALGANSASTGMTPQAGNGGFDPSTFRTGFTPGGGTGFTPGFGGMMGLGSMVNGMPSFPLPSPNTAAFLSMVTNNTPGAGGAGETSGAGSTVNGSSATNTNGGSQGQSSSNNGDGSQASLSRATTHGVQQGPPPGGPNPSAMVDITPNTLNALTGVINQMDQEERQREEGRRRYSGQQPPSYHGAIGPHGPSQPQAPPQAAQRPPGPDMPPVHPGATLMHHADSYFPQQPQGMQQQGGPGHHNGTGNPHQFHPGPMHGHHHGPPGMPQGHPGPHGSLPPSHLHQGGAGMHPGPGMDYVRTDPNGHPIGPPPPGPAGPDASGAVNGLFLLSQAHQELSKREEQEQHVDPPKPVVPAAGGKKGAKANNKRKTSEGAAPTKAKPPAKKSKKNAPAPEPPSPDFMNSFGDSDDDMGGMNGYDDDEGTSPRGDRKPETEEEKRKNFLERNRQGECGDVIRTCSGSRANVWIVLVQPLSNVVNAKRPG
jgi:ATF/CREB family transcription factor